MRHCRQILERIEDGLNTSSVVRRLLSAEASPTPFLLYLGRREH